MATLDVIVGGTTYSLSDGTYTYWLAEEGFGLAEIERFSEAGPLQHGETDQGFLLRPRLCRVVLFINGSSESDLESKRLSLSRFFPALDAAVKIKKTLGGGGVRQLDCHRVDWQERPREGFGQEIAIALRAPEPSWYDPSQQTTNIPQSGSGTGVPMAVPLAVGSSSFDESATIAYAGTWRSYPTLRITGPITDPIISNTTTGDTLTFSTTIDAGDYYDIDLAYGAKTVQDQDGTNQISTLSTDSDLATFHLAPAVDGTASRNNTIQMAGGGANGDTNLRIQYYTRYAGI